MRVCRRLAVGLVAMAVVCVCEAATRRYEVAGMVVAVDRLGGKVVVSHEAIAGYMDAMAMPFQVRDWKGLEGLSPGMKVAFTLVVEEGRSSWAERMRIVPYRSNERDPEFTRQLELLDSVIRRTPAPLVKVGQPVPDFNLVDQENRPFALSDLAGRTVAMNFVYTRCPLPDYCFRISNNLANLRKRFAARLGRDLVLVTVTFDPAHDSPDVLAKYAQIWKADARTWRFLTGNTADVRRVCGLFGVSFWQEEGAYVHSLHTVVIDRNGRLAANVEGNQYTARQLGDLVESVLTRSATRAPVTAPGK